MENAEVKKIQKVALDILLEIDRICQANDIEYMLSCGTALGAVRHQGFIPWDDDLDIAMTRENYERFVQVLPTALGEDYYYHCFEADCRYNVLLPNMKVRKKGTCILERNKLLRHHCDGNGLFVDVFVFDKVSEKGWQNILMRIWMYFLGGIIFVLDNLHLNPVILKKLFVNSARGFHRANRNSHKWGLTMMWLFVKPTCQRIYPERILFPLQRMPFEGGMFPMAHDPDAFLRIEIGDDYMILPPIEKRLAKHTVAFSVTSDDLDPNKTIYNHE